MTIEIIKYKVLETDGNFEIRQYGEHITASVTIDAGFIDALNSGYRIISDYFSGQNWAKTHGFMKDSLNVNITSHEKIGITTPIYIKTVDEAKRYTISFIMPVKFTKDNLPEPFDKRIIFQPVRSYTAAVMSFKGYLDDNVAIVKISTLEKWLQQKGDLYTSEFIFAIFLSSLIPGRFRRIEVLAKLEDSH